MPAYRRDMTPEKVPGDSGFPSTLCEEPGAGPVTSPSAGQDEGAGLFRKEVMVGRRPHMTGEVLLTARPLANVGVALALLLVVALGLLIVLGSYTRRATVIGHLVPVQGVMRIVAPQGATVLEQRVREGQRVERGDVLYVLSTDRQGAGDGGGYQQAISGSIGQRRALLEAERQRTVDSIDADIASLQRRVKVMSAERSQIQLQQEEQQRRVTLAEESRNRQRVLYDQGLITRETWQERERDYSDQRQRQQTLAREALTLQRDQEALVQQLEQSRAQRQTRQQAIERELALLGEQLTDAEARRRIVITAPQAGRATLVQGSAGTTVDAVRPLLTLLPDDVTLQATLYAPSRTVGFVRPGTAVWLRHEAYPYQKFGHQRGEVVAVSTFPAEQDDLPGLAAYAAASGAEPLYAITVRLPQQTLSLNGLVQALRPGLRVQADLLMERRHLWEWMVEPLLTARRAIAA